MVVLEQNNNIGFLLFILHDAKIYSLASWNVFFFFFFQYSLVQEMATHSSILAWEVMDRGARWATVHEVTKELDTT